MDSSSNLSPRPHVILHEGLARSCRIHILKKVKENLIPQEKAPVSGRMRDGEKGLFPEPYLASKKDTTVSEDEGYSWDDGFCDFAIRLRAE